VEQNQHTLPNGDTMSGRELDILLNETWSAYGEAQREDSQNVSKLQALAARINLINQSRFGGFEDTPPMYHDSDKMEPAFGEPPPNPTLEAAVDVAWKAWRANPTEANKFALAQAQKARYETPPRGPVQSLLSGG
jgi:hypothetical protein